MPVREREDLVEGVRGHGAAPDHRLVLVDHEADRVDLEPVGLEGLHRLAVDRHRLAARAEHRGLGRAVDVRVEDAHAGALVRKGEGEVRRDRGLADAALARGDGDQILHAGHDALRALDLVGDDVLPDVGGDALDAERLHRLLDRAPHALGGEAGRIAELDVNGHAAGVIGLDALEHAAGDVVPADDGIDELREAFLDLGSGDGHQ